MRWNVGPQDPRAVHLCGDSGCEVVSGRDYEGFESLGQFVLSETRLLGGFALDFLLGRFRSEERSHVEWFSGTLLQAQRVSESSKLNIATNRTTTAMRPQMQHLSYNHGYSYVIELGSSNGVLPVKNNA